MLACERPGLLLLAMLFFCAPPEFEEAEAESVAAELVMAEPVGALAELEAFLVPELAEPLAERNLEFDSVRKSPPSKEQPPSAPD